MRPSTDLSLFTYHCPIQVRWMDYDPLQHVNNSMYFQYYEFARGKYMGAASKQWDWHKNMFLIAHISCDFIKELHLSDRDPNVHVRTTRFGTKSFNLEYAITSQGGVLHAVGKSVQVMYDVKIKTTRPLPEWLIEEITAYEKTGSIEL